MMTDKPSKAEEWIERLRNFGARTANRSPLVAVAGQAKGIGDYPACATCPAGMWFVTDELLCFCKVMKRDIFGIGRTPVVACDERELLLAEKDSGTGPAPRVR